MSSQSKHWLDSKCHTFFDFSIKVLGVVMRDDQPGMEGSGNSMSSEISNYSVVEAFGIGLDNPANHINRTPRPNGCDRTL